MATIPEHMQKALAILKTYESFWHPFANHKREVRDIINDINSAPEDGNHIETHEQLVKRLDSIDLANPNGLLSTKITEIKDLIHIFPINLSVDYSRIHALLIQELPTSSISATITTEFYPQPKGDFLTRADFLNRFTSEQFSFKAAQEGFGINALLQHHALLTTSSDGSHALQLDLSDIKEEEQFTLTL